MASRAYMVAAAVADAIIGASLSEQVSASVAWMPIIDRADSDALACWVVPVSEAPTPLTRGSASVQCEVSVGLHRAAASEDDLGDLASLLVEIGDALMQRSLTIEAGQAHFVSLRIEPLVDIEAWNTRQQYLGVLRITYRIAAVI